jgi:hypothetical protein
MDDGGIIGDVEFLKKVWKLLKERGPALGLILNPSKCEWSWLDPDCTEPCPIEGVAFVPHSEIQMLGVSVVTSLCLGLLRRSSLVACRKQ